MSSRIAQADRVGRTRACDERGVWLRFLGARKRVIIFVLSRTIRDGKEVEAHDRAAGATGREIAEDRRGGDRARRGRRLVASTSPSGSRSAARAGARRRNESAAASRSPWAGSLPPSGHRRKRCIQIVRSYEKGWLLTTRFAVRTRSGEPFFPSGHAIFGALWVRPGTHRHPHSGTLALSGRA